MDRSGDTTVSSYVAINTATKTAAPAEEFTLSITKIGDGTVTWSSSDPASAEVQGAGLSAKVIAKKCGDATITANVAAAGNYQAGSAKCNVKVRIGNLEQLKAYVATSDDVTAWLSSENTITIDEDLDFSGKKVTIKGDKDNPAKIKSNKTFLINDNFALENVVIDNSSDTKISFIKLASVESQKNFDAIILKNVKITGLSSNLINANKQNYLINEVKVDNCVIEVKGGDKHIFDFKEAGCMANLTISNSTLYATSTTKHTGRILQQQSGKKMVDDLKGTGFTFTLENSTLCNLMTDNNYVLYLRQNNQTWITYNVNNNIVVDCMKQKGKFMSGVNTGNNDKDLKCTWNVDKNLINYAGENTKESEVAGVNKDKDGNPRIKNCIEGLVSFADPDKGDFTQSLTKEAGDPRWKK